MSKRVLVVDDEKLIVKGIRFSLEQEGMEVDCAYDGEEALENASEAYRTGGLSTNQRVFICSHYYANCKRGRYG